jgi:hypothetical protein
MAHYAFLDENSIVVKVIVGKNEDEPTPEGFNNWEDYYLSIHNEYSSCKKTSYNTKEGIHLTGGTPFRGNYAGLGMKYDSTNDIFINPKPYDSWVLNTTTALWEAPVAMPEVEGESYAWNEEGGAWELITLE